MVNANACCVSVAVLTHVHIAMHGMDNVLATVGNVTNALRRGVSCDVQCKCMSVDVLAHGHRGCHAWYGTMFW